jgi:hypothetical protein
LKIPKAVYDTQLLPPCNQLLEEVDTLARVACGRGMKGKEEGQALNALSASSTPVTQ